MSRFETFVQEVYAMSQHFVVTQLPPEPRRRGRKPALSRAAVLTLALVSQLQRFASERDFMRAAEERLGSIFPTLPDRSQVNRAIRQHRPTLDAFGQWCAAQAVQAPVAYELLDSTAKVLRNNHRRGCSPLGPLCAVGRTLRLGFFHGVRVLVAAPPEGLITGTLVGPGNRNDRPLADTFFAARTELSPPAADPPRTGCYLADTGFAGRARQAQWRTVYGAEVIAPPQSDSADRWPDDAKQTHSRRRQRIETVIGRLLHDFRLERDRPKTEAGLLSRLAAKVGLHNFLLGKNRRDGRPDFAIAEVIGW